MYLVVGKTCIKCKMLEAEIANAGLDMPETKLAEENMDLCRRLKIQSIPALVDDNENVIFDSQKIMEALKSTPDETLLSIAKWHEETFPDATLDGQLDKYQEEQNEWIDSDHKDFSELADMLIVACGVMRFSLESGLFLLNDINAWLTDVDFSRECLVKEVNKKMAENRKRTWKKAGTSYHHV